MLQCPHAAPTIMLRHASRLCSPEPFIPFCPRNANLRSPSCLPFSSVPHHSLNQGAYHPEDSTGGILLIFRHVSSPARIQRKRDPVSRVPDRFHLSDISLSEDTGITPPALRSHLPLQPELLPWAAPHRRPSFRPIPTRQSRICRFCPAYRRWNSGSCTFLSEASSLQW